MSFRRARMRRRSRAKRFLTVLAAAGALALAYAPVASAEPAPAAPPAVETAAQELPPPPPPAPPGALTAQGEWHGPYHIQALNSSKCLDMNNSTAEGAGAIQYTCQSGRNTQRWWAWDAISDCCVSAQYLYNAHSGMCLESWSGWREGHQLTQGYCNWDETERWWITGGVTSGFWTYKNEFSQKCMDVSNGSTANGAVIWQYTCNGTAAQAWHKQQF